MSKDVTTPSLQSKLPAIGTSVFTTFSSKAAELNAINLAQGFPNFGCDPVLANLVAEGMQKGMNQYAHSAGMVELRMQTALHIQNRYGYTADPETEVTITSGATEAIYAAISCIINPEDEIIVFDPAYDSYIPAINLSGGIPVHIPLEYPDYKINWDTVKKRVNRKTRAILLNTPHNPTGTLLTPQDMEELSDIVSGNSIYIISDEVYENIIFDGMEHQSVLRYPQLASRSFMIGSFGKTLHVTGWKVGYCIAPPVLTKEFRKLHQFITFCTATPFQYAIAEYLKRNDTLYTDIQKLYTDKRNLFANLMQKSRFEPLSCKGTYFQLYSYKNISALSDMDFCMELVEKHGVAAIPVSTFYKDKTDNHVIRFCFAKEDETLIKAAEILCQL